MLMAYQGISSYLHSEIDSLDLEQTLSRGLHTNVAAFLQEAHQTCFVVDTRTSSNWRCSTNRILQKGSLHTGRCLWMAKKTDIKYIL